MIQQSYFSAYTWNGYIPFQVEWMKDESSNLKKNMCPPMFITGLFTIATCRQPKYPSTGELMKNMWCVCVCVDAY